MLGKEEYQKVYEMLDRADPVPYDCGMRCGSVCCMNDSFDTGTEPYIYLFPGENEYLSSEGAAIRIKRELRKDHDLPSSYGKYVYVACCSGPDSCDRRFRPIQCRSFPLWPRITESGELLLSFYDGELPYTCPLIKEKITLSEEFVTAAYEAWEILTGDDAVRDLILMDSGRL